MTKKISIHNAFKDFFISKLSNSRLTLDYDKKEMYNKFDSKLKEIGQEYRTILINFGQSKYFIINLAMSKLMEMEQTDRNKVALYLFNNIKIQ